MVGRRVRSSGDVGTDDLATIAEQGSGGIPLSFERQAFRVILMMGFAAGILGWTVARTPVIWADGLRYISQAKEIERGINRETLSKAIDHPVYPLALASVHRLIGDSSPASWQLAGQLASVVSAILLVIPLYLVALELFGETAAWMAAILTFLVPIPGHVMADALSESTFLLIWMWGIWFALRFLRQGNPAWLFPVVAASGVAYLTRPEGLLLPAALIATLGLMPLIPAIRLGRTRWWIAVSFLVIGPVMVAAPFIALRGGIGTKPAVARLVGLAPKGPGMGVGREWPVRGGQSATVTLGLAVRAMTHAVAEAVTIPLLVLAPLGFFASKGRCPSRSRLFVGAVIGGWILALMRLHATGGYCTPRHALIAALPLIAAGAAGLSWLIRVGLERLEATERLLPAKRPGYEVAASFLLLGVFGALWAPETLAPLNPGYAGYRQAGEWLAEHSNADAKVFDLKGWAIFYSRHPGYSFNRISEGSEDRSVRWLVAHDALLTGPWFYCDIVRNMVQGRKPVESFPKHPHKGVAWVHVFDLSQGVEGERADLASQPLKGRQTR